MRRASMVLCLLLAGCATERPLWRDEALRWLETYREQALAGHARLAPGAHLNALREFKRGADWEGVALAQLTRCAVERVVDSEPAGCAAYREQSPLGATPAHDAYMRFLEGGMRREDAALLPAVYAGVADALADGDREALAARLQAIEPPLSRLVALAVSWRQLPAPLPALEDCETIAGRQGWLAAYRACLTRAIGVLKAGGDSAGAAERERRLRMLNP